MQEVLISFVVVAPFLLGGWAKIMRARADLIRAKRGD
jgi:hypothetical protein